MIMANWASVRYRIEGKQNDLQEIYDQYQTLLNKKQYENGDDKQIWKSEITDGLGIDSKNSSLRGYILKCEFTGESLSVEAEEAWGLTDFRHLLESHYKGMSIYYMLEEPCCDVYVTNDAEGKYFPTRVVVDIHIKNVESHKEFTNKKVALDYIAHTLNRDALTVEYIDKWNEVHEDDYIGFHEYEVMPRITKQEDSEELTAAYMKAVETGDNIAQIIYGRLIAMT